MNYEMPSAPLSIGGVLDNAIRLYRYAIRHCWVLALIYALAMGGFGIFWGLATANAIVPGRTPDPKLAAAMLFSPVNIAGFLLAVVISLIFYGALMKAESTLAQGAPPLSAGEAIAASLARVPRMLLASFINVLVIGIGLILFIIPGIYFLGKLQLWTVAMFMEDASALESLKISWRLTRKRWWRSTVILGVAAILIYVFALIFGFVGGLLSALSHGSVAHRLVINQLFEIPSNFITFPMFMAINIAMYHDFKLRSEGGDLAVRMGALGKV
jgi:hypothetical protein